MASAVATPLEQQFAAIPGLAEMTSTSGIGSTAITMQFDLERNIDGAAQDVLTAINAATGVLPKDLPNPPTYRKTNPADRPVLIYVVHSDAMPIYKADEYAFTVLAQKLSTVKGVSQVQIYGQKPYAAHIQVNPGALAARGIGLEDVRGALVAATVNRPKGNLEGLNQAITLDTNDQLFNASSFGNVIVAPSGRHHKGAASAPSGVDPALGACRPDFRPLAGHPRCGPRRAVYDDADDRTRHPRHLPVPADLVGNGDPEHGRAVVAACYFRGHVRCRL
jgi:multidrug efflux pump subunit AcrB